MSDYQAPLRDIRFILEELAGLGDIGRLPGCGEATPDLVSVIHEEAGKFASGVLAPLNPVGDRQGCRLEGERVIMAEGWREAYRQFVAAGWVGLSLPTEHGGQGMPKIVSTPVAEMWSSANMAFAMLPHLNVGEVEALALAASEEIKARYLSRLASGEWGGTMNLTEAQAGSDLSTIRTRAEAAPDGSGSYHLFGQKIFISYGEHDLTENIIHLVLARMPDAPPGIRGISLFLVPKFLVEADGSLAARNDVRCIALEHKLGIHGSPTCTMSYGDNGGAVGYLVGKPNRGLETMFVMMNDARFGVGLQGIALGEVAYQKALSFARERVQGRDAVSGRDGVAIISHPDVRRMLLTMRAKVMAPRMLAYVASGWFDSMRHHPDAAVAERYRRYVDLLMPVVKAWSTELGNEVAGMAIQIHGGMGFVEETGIAQHFRDARVITIYEGTTGIQANDLVGRKILREGGESLRLLIAEMRGVAGELASRDQLAVLGPALVRDLDTLEQTLEWILANGRERQAEVLAGAVPFLHLLGTVCGSWQMARAGLAAHARLDADDGDTEYLEGIVDLVHFYFGHLAPMASGLTSIVMEGGASVVKPGEAIFG
ncbi:MAG: acyl-CoA dehydrogenase [Sulfuritalea sp.]|nr:acyl-CoA dehydrogenase [Sulfuritalea sp.]